MTDGHERITDELRRLDDELAAAVTLPSVDAVIRRARMLSRASTAAAAAVLTVGALGATTAVAQLTAPPAEVENTAAITPGAGRSEQTQVDAGGSLGGVMEQVPAPVGGVPLPAETAPVEQGAVPPPFPSVADPVAPPPPYPGPPPRTTTTRERPPATTTTRPNDEGDEDEPTRTRTTRPEPTDDPTPTTKPAPTEPEPTEPEPTEPEPTESETEPPEDPPSSSDAAGTSTAQPST